VEYDFAEVFQMKEHDFSELNNIVEHANLLRNRYDETGDITLLDKCIELQRLGLDLCPIGTSNFAALLNSLARSLFAQFEQAGNTALLGESVELFTEALRLIPQGDRHRAAACGNLAVSLITAFNQTGDVALLDQAISLESEALQLLPLGEPDRAIICGNLARSLLTRFKQTGDEVMLDDAISLQREALQLRPLGHPDRAMACGNLAGLLITQFGQSGDEVQLDEAIRMEREALQLRPFGHPDRAMSCGNLARAVVTRFDQTEDEVLLDEAISLEREALRLRPVGHPQRPLLCSNLASTLLKYITFKADEKVIDECRTLGEEAIALMPADHPDKWRPQMLLAHLYLDPRYGDVEAAVKMILDAVSHNASDLPSLLARAAYYLDAADAVDDTTSVKEMLVQCYVAIIDLAFLVAGFVLDHSRQLQYLNCCRHLASGACSAAMTIGDINGGLELLERARGIVWTQSLHLRDPQLQDLDNVRPDMAQELTTLLQSLGSRRFIENHAIAHRGKTTMHYLHNLDMRHQEHGRAQRLIREVRELSGFDHFMRGPPHSALRRTTATHPVVVLIAKGDECYAIIMRTPEEPVVSVPLTHIKASEIQTLMLEQSASRLRGSSSSMDDTDRSGISKSQRPPAFNRMLARLWIAVVKPVIDHLGLTVGS
jgi:hypothetical protein